MRVVPDNNTIRRHPVALILISGEMTALYTADGPAREPPYKMESEVIIITEMDGKTNNYFAGRKEMKL